MFPSQSPWACLLLLLCAYVVVAAVIPNIAHAVYKLRIFRSARQLPQRQVQRDSADFASSASQKPSLTLSATKKCHWIPPERYEQHSEKTSYFHSVNQFLVPPSSPSFINDRFFFDPVSRECSVSVMTDAPFDTARHCEAAECKREVNPCQYNICKRHTTCIWYPYMNCINEPCPDYVCEKL